jgi:hypothetical protein
MARTSRETAFSAVELLVMIAVVVALGLLFLRPKPDRKGGRIKCVNNLKNVGLAFRIFATDHNDKFPGSLLMSNITAFASIDIEQVFNLLTNELSTPKILFCPEDRERRPAESFASFGAQNVSYFVSLSADENRPQSFLAGDRDIQVNGKLASRLQPLTSNDVLFWSGAIHVDQGNIALGDGSVHQMSSERLKASLKDLGRSTNYLVFPQ